MIQVFALFAVLQLASSLELYNINESFDEKLASYNAAADPIMRGVGSAKVSVGPFTVSNWVLIGDNTRYRVGSANIEGYKNGSYHLDTTIAWRLFVLAFGELEYKGRTMTGVFSVGESEFHLSYKVHNASDSCSVELNHFHFHELGKVRLDSSLPEFDGQDFSEVFEEEVLPKVNEYFDSIQHGYEKFLEDEVCGRTDSPIPKFTVLSFKEIAKH